MANSAIVGIISGGGGGDISLTPNQFKTLKFNAAPAVMEFGIEIGDGTDPVVLNGGMDAAAIKAAIEDSDDFAGFTVDVYGSTTTSTGTDGVALHSGKFILAVQGTEPYPAWAAVQNSEVQQFSVTDGDGGNYTLNGGANFVMGASESSLQANQRDLGGDYTNVVIKGQSNATEAGGPLLVDGTASASGEYSGAYTASNAFDGDTETSWFFQDSPPRWLRYDRGIGAPDLPVENYGIRTATNHKPTEWVLRTSPDATSWTNLDSKSGQSLAGDTNTVFSVSGTVQRYVELVFTEDSSSGISTQIAEFSVNSDTLPAAANMKSYFPYGVGDVANPSATGTDATVSTLHHGGSTSTLVTATDATIEELLISGLILPESTTDSGAFTPAEPSHWSSPPTTITQALNQLAAAYNTWIGPV